MVKNNVISAMTWLAKQWRDLVTINMFLLKKLAIL